MTLLAGPPAGGMKPIAHRPAGTMPLQPDGRAPGTVHPDAR